MKESKECTTCKHFANPHNEHPCKVCIIINNVGFDKWEPIEPKAMKNETSKQIIEVIKDMLTTDSDSLAYPRIISIVMIPYLCFIAMSAVGTEITTSSYTFKGMAIGLLMTIGIWLLGYFSRKPDPNRKGFKKWIKSCILIVKIYLKERELKPYPTLNKIKHQKHKELREMVKQWRLELNELKIELKQIID